MNQEGSVENYTDRCLVAILKLQAAKLCWPNPAERKVVKEAVKVSSNGIFRDCVGFVDGTLIPLAYAPTKNKEDYWTRKNHYALNTMLVCDHRKKITYAMNGWCGSAHDQRVFNSSSVSDSCGSRWGPYQF